MHHETSTLQALERALIPFWQRWKSSYRNGWVNHIITTEAGDLVREVSPYWGTVRNTFQGISTSRIDFLRFLQERVYHHAETLYFGEPGNALRDPTLEQGKRTAYCRKMMMMLTDLVEGDALLERILHDKGGDISLPQQVDLPSEMPPTFKIRREQPLESVVRESFTETRARAREKGLDDKTGIYAAVKASAAAAVRYAEQSVAVFEPDLLTEQVSCTLQMYGVSPITTRNALRSGPLGERIVADAQSKEIVPAEDVGLIQKGVYHVTATVPGRPGESVEIDLVLVSREEKDPLRETLGKIGARLREKYHVDPHLIMGTMDSIYATLKSPTETGALECVGFVNALYDAVLKTVIEDIPLRAVTLTKVLQKIFTPLNLEVERAFKKLYDSARDNYLRFQLPGGITPESSNQEETLSFMLEKMNADPMYQAAQRKMESVGAMLYQRYR